MVSVPVNSIVSPKPMKDPLTTKSPPKTLTSVLVLAEPDTKNVVSVPGIDGNEAFGRFATITDPDTPITELDCELPDTFPTKAIFTS
jgi:hypothetical protein